MRRIFSHRSILSTLSIVAILSIAVFSAPLRAQEEADQAWAQGRLEIAERLYSARLAADSSDARALHRVALIRAWGERYDEALSLFDRLLRVDPANREARVDRARVLAWRGDPAAAVRAVDELLARDPAFLPALEARAQFAGWAGEYDEALRTYGRILEITPGSRAVELDRARVLSWASRWEAAEATYDSLLRIDPNDREARLGLAQVLAWSSRLDSAAMVYRRILAADPGSVDAQKGLARTAGWGGRLTEAERRWRQVLARHPNDTEALVGLSQTLRWQGRDAAALSSASRAVQAAPTDRDARTELRWARLAVAPRVAPAFTYESDSDGNRISTLTTGAAWRPTPRVEVRGDAYLRDAGQKGGETPDGAARGAALSLWTQLEPGWSLLAGAGAGSTDRDEEPTRPSWRAALSSPGRYPVSATLAYSHRPLDETALLITRDVEIDELTLSWQVTPGLGLVLSGAGGYAEYRGNVSGQTNERLGGNLALTRRFARYFTLGGATRWFAFSDDLADGYFDPDFYRLTEGVVRFGREWRRVGVDLGVAPGVQQVGEDGDRTGSFRANGGLSWLIAPGRRIGVSAAYANSGLSSLSPTADGDYEYRAISMNANWTF